MSTHVPGFQSFLDVLHHFVLAKFRAVHRYPVPASYRIPSRKIPVNTCFNI